MVTDKNERRQIFESAGGWCGVLEESLRAWNPWWVPEGGGFLRSSGDPFHDVAERFPFLLERREERVGVFA